MKCLGILGKALRDLGINAEFEQWEGKVPDYYWVFTYISPDNNFETNCKSGLIILDGFTRKNISQLERQKETIIETFQDFRKAVGNTTVFLCSDGGQLIPNSYNPEIKRIQINIEFKEWRV